MVGHPHHQWSLHIEINDAVQEVAHHAHQLKSRQGNSRQHIADASTIWSHRHFCVQLVVEYGDQVGTGKEWELEGDTNEDQNQVGEWAEDGRDR